MGDNLVYAVRGNTGFSLKRGLGDDAQLLFHQESSKDSHCNVFAYSNGGYLFAYCDGLRTRVIEIATGKFILDVELKRTRQFLFSPKDNYLLIYEPYAIYGAKTSPDQKPDPNVRVFSMADGKHLSTFTAPNESTWEPKFSDDESIAVRMMKSEVLVYTDLSFSRYENKLVEKDIGSIALSPGIAPYHVALYIPAKGASPARVRVHRLNKDFSVIANRTFFKSDRATMTWNHKGSALLILAMVEVDQTNKSYYGEQSLFLINILNDESGIVPLGKKGPIYSAKWNPNGKEFAVCYGYMPAKVTFYNLKGDPTFDTNEGPRNDIFYNAFGNILLVCGFGNLSKGKMEFWDVEKKKEIISIEVPNTTLFEWAPDGQHFLTSTTAPRLRMDNSYRFWHYTGRMINEVTFDSPKEELWEVKWRPMTGYNKFEVKTITKSDQLAAGLRIKTKDATNPLNNLPAGAVRQQGAYIPPHLRKANGNSTKKGGNGATPLKPVQNEIERRIMQLKKKVDDIKILKERIEKGEKLNPNQIEKIKKEEEFVAEIQALSI